MTDTASSSQPNLSQDLADIRLQIENLQLPVSAFLGIHISPDQNSFQVAKIGGQRITFHRENTSKSQLEQDLLNWIQAQSQNQLKIIAAGLGKRHSQNPLVSKLWLEHDIVPHLISHQTHSDKDDIIDTARKVSHLFNPDNSAKPILNDAHRVKVASLVKLSDYQQLLSPNRFKQLTSLAHSFQGKKLRFFSATPQGGGVALMRHALIRLYHLLGVDAQWHVLQDKPEVFAITKTKFHNVLQNVAAANVRLNPTDQELFKAWSQDNAQYFQDVFSDADVVVIDDPQPAGLVPHIRKQNRHAKILYRSHIQLEAHLANEPGTPQHATWEFIWDQIKSVDGFISHPVKGFVPANVPSNLVVTMPPTTDPLDGLNKPLSAEQQTYYLKLFDKLLLETNQTPLDLNRPIITQIARFDPSKGIPDVLDAFAQLRKKLQDSHKPQLIIAGNGSVDDPDGVPILNLIRHTLTQTKFASLAPDIKIARLPHIDQLLNTLLRVSHIVLQLSHKEGFEVKVSEALMKGIPVVAYRAGGIPLQIKHGQTGFLASVGNIPQVVDYLHQLLTKPKLHAQISSQATSADHFWVQTPSNAINWLFLADQVLKHGQISGKNQPLSLLLDQHFASSLS